MVFIPIPSTPNESIKDIDGIGRGNYAISVIGIAILAAIAYSASGNAIWGYIYGVVFALFPTYLRLKNLEWSPWILVTIFVPGINILLAFALVILPEDYAETKKLDRDAKVILSFGFAILLLLTLFYGSISYRSWRNSRPQVPVHRDGK